MGSAVRPDLLVHLRRARDHADRHFDEPLDLPALAAVAALSPWYFHRLFTATYGVSPAAHLSQRRVERAADLLRSTDLSVTEVCHLVGFTSVGSFSSRFRALVGESPSAYHRRWSAAGAPRVPSCWMFMAGLAAARVGPPEGADRAKQEKRDRTGAPRLRAMITNISLVSLWVTDIDEALAFYTDVLGFEAKDDIQLAEDFRWCTVGHPSQPELQVHLTTPSHPLPDDLIAAMRRAQAAGGLPGIGLQVDDCRATYAELSTKGVEFLQPPTERPYGVEAVMRDSSGNWMVLIEPSEFDPESMTVADLG